MKWATAGLMAIYASVVLLRYLACVQKNNYEVGVDLKTVGYYFISLSFLILPLLAEVFCPTDDLHSAVKIVILCAAIGGTYFYTFSFKTRVVFTKRARANYEISLLFSTLFIVLNCIFLDTKPAVFANLGQALLVPLYLIFSIIITKPYFEKKNRLFIEKKKERLAGMKLVKIGITGSYGKTGCKNILYKMLSKKYKTAVSPSNYNTPMGMALTIEKMKGDEEILIAEMGARRKGDIRELCEIIKPDIGLITGVCEQHLKTFKALHEIFLEKRELSENTAVCFFNGNDKLSLKMYKERKNQKYKACVEKNGFVYADNICSNEIFYVTFDLHIGENKYRVTSRLIGKHNIQNIVMCAAVAKFLSVDDADIVNAIEESEPVSHRLSYSYSNGIHILDDGYNSNPKGIKYAMEAIDCFKGRKVVVGQGLFECGKKKKLLNEQVGGELGRHADVLILCGPNRKYIKEGVKKSWFKGEIYEYKNLKQAQKKFKEILRKGDLLLLQNDIPDIF